MSHRTDDEYVNRKISLGNQDNGDDEKPLTPADTTSRATLTCEKGQSNEGAPLVNKLHHRASKEQSRTFR